MNVLALGERERMRRLAPRIKRVHFSMRVAQSPGELASRLRTERPDLVLVDRQMPHLSGRKLLEQLLAEDPTVPILIVQDIDRLKPDTLARVAGLSERTHAETRHAPPKALPPHALPPLHHPTSGRVDARRIAAFFDLSLAEVARLLGRSPQSVHKTPDAPALQEPLSALVRIASSLTALFGTTENARVWLNAPHPDLDNARPIELVRRRKAAVAAELLEDALRGHPS